MLDDPGQFGNRSGQTGGVVDRAEVCAQQQVAVVALVGLGFDLDCPEQSQPLDDDARGETEHLDRNTERAE